MFLLEWQVSFLMSSMWCKNYSITFWHWQLIELHPLHDWVPYIWPKKSGLCCNNCSRLNVLTWMTSINSNVTKGIKNYSITLWHWKLIELCPFHDWIPYKWTEKLLFHVITIVPGRINILVSWISFLLLPKWCKYYSITLWH